MNAIKHFLSFRMLLLTLVLVSSACSKSDDPILEPELAPETAQPVPYYELQRVENFHAPVDDSNPTTTPPTVYFSLTYNKEAKSEYLKTTLWDVSFGGLYNSFLGGNNGNATKKNVGYGGPGLGGILLIEKPFEEVTEVPEDDLFATGSHLIGNDISGAFSSEKGWYLYDFDGTIKGDGSKEKQHVAHAMSDSRTIVIRTAKGDYAKIKMISCYKDAFTPAEWFKDTPHMYFTFEYVIVPNGSKVFEIKSTSI